MDEEKKLYAVTADYRDPPVTYPYFVWATSEKDAKKRFSSKFTWLKVYKVERHEGEMPDPLCIFIGK